MIAPFVFITSCMFLWRATEACLCMPNHPQNSFCKADFAIQVEVLGKAKYAALEDMKKFQEFGFMLPTFAKYKMRALRIFKGSEELQKVKNGDVINFKEFDVRTPETNNVCGANFTVGKTYLITGRIIRGELNVNKCDWVTEWNQLTNRMKEGIDGDYDCRCHVATCIDGYCDRNIGCKWQVTWDRPLDECKMKHSVCKRTILNTCKWDDNCLP